MRSGTTSEICHLNIWWACQRRARKQSKWKIWCAWLKSENTFRCLLASLCCFLRYQWSKASTFTHTAVHWQKASQVSPKAVCWKNPNQNIWNDKNTTVSYPKQVIHPSQIWWILKCFKNWPSETSVWVKHQVECDNNFKINSLTTSKWQNNLEKVIQL